MFRWWLTRWCVACLLGVPSVGWAHTPHMACYDNGDQTISCFAEFSDGTSAAGSAMRVVDPANQVLIEGVIDETGEFTFDRPQGEFTVIFDAGPNHIVQEKSQTITP